MGTAAAQKAPKTAANGALTVERSHLLQGIAQVVPVCAPTGTSMPVLYGIRLERESADRLRLTATDLEIAISTTIPADIPGPFESVVPARLLRALVKEAAGPLSLTFDAADNEIKISWARTVASLRALPITEWPRLPFAESGKTFTLTASDIDLIRKAANFASRDDARPILTSILLSPDGCVATDSYRLAWAKLDAVIDEPVLIPARIASLLPMKLLGTETAVVTLGGGKHGSDYCMIQVGEVQIRSVLVDGEFPPFKKLIPDKPRSGAEFNRVELAQAVKTASVVARDAIPFRITFDGKKEASIVADCEDVGQTCTQIDVTARAGRLPDHTCAFNPRYFSDLVNSLSGDTVTLELVDALKPVVVHEGPWTMVIMPVRVS